ncbi:MAG: phosphate signaling complex protein PhoU [Spirochaetia bacterium]|nr:phosphate signaling complex protein PhoU [Spirochaetota bacterium]MCX8096521.1 phosphate signaling complex protein PhoU [Spirochaetota bacterium]MDW8112679.1 phosphate signaling complex protein PhoU [Spirochaetia bacterium]
MIKLERELTQIEEEIINNASLVTEMLYQSIKGLRNFDKGICEKVIKSDEKADNLEIDIESRIIRAIALYQPEAEMLRKLVMAVKINKDIERIGDHAVNIASNTIKSLDLGKIEFPEEIDKMFNVLTVMLNKTVRAFVDHNSELAREVITMDKEVDELRNKGIRRIIQENQKENSTEKTVLLLLVFKDLERIGDLLTNIAEDTVYIIEGKMIEHKYR